MLELPESYTLSLQSSPVLFHKEIRRVTVAASPHKFAFYFGDPEQYPSLLEGRSFSAATALGGMLELCAGPVRLLFGDGASPRYLQPGEKTPAKHQLLLEFEDGAALVCTIQMYGGMWAFQDGEKDDFYYCTAKEKPSPLSDRFDREYFSSLLSSSKPSLSAKAFLATEQRIPGLGNGCLQDILFAAKINPRTKLQALSSQELDNLFQSVKQTLYDMCIHGGRDTEKDLFGQKGGYPTRLSKNTLALPCPVCGSSIVKQAYLGGAVYFCPTCQPVPC